MQNVNWFVKNSATQFCSVGFIRQEPVCLYMLLLLEACYRRQAFNGYIYTYTYTHTYTHTHTHTRTHAHTHTHTHTQTYTHTHTHTHTHIYIYLYLYIYIRQRVTRGSVRHEFEYKRVCFHCQAIRN